MKGARFTPVVERGAFGDWVGKPVGSELEAIAALRDMLKSSKARVLAARIDVTGVLVVPLKDLGVAK